MCKCNGELVSHLFLHCLVAMDLWSMVLDLFGVICHNQLWGF